MKYAILQCDSVQEKFRSACGNYPEMIENMFTRAGYKHGSLKADVYDCQAQQYPAHIDDYDFFITTGSKYSAYDDDPWIKRLIEFVQLLDARQKKLIGICFGHQIIALARGCKVEKSAKGWGVGIAKNTLLKTPEWMQESLPDLNIIASHQDQVPRLPDDAELIASSEFCPNFMVQWNDHFLSIQGHPEWLNDYSKTLMNDRKDIIPPQQLKAGLNSLSGTPDNGVFARWIINFVGHKK